MTTLLPRLNADLGEVADQVRASLVRVEAGRRGSGSGVVLDAGGLIVTNAHVVPENLPSGGLHVTLADGRRVGAELLARDAQKDVAALRIEADGLTAIKTGDSRSLRAGEWVLAMGHALGVAGAATAGIVIGSGADLPEIPKPGQEWVAVGLSLRPGHSGGPLVDAHGRMVGMNTMMAGLEVGMAVPVHVIQEFLEERVHREGPPSSSDAPAEAEPVMV